ncbi:hypothetical protein [Aedoeadaptatus ivorii]|uniref:hypothetical protein n=1 Tax=Aedoeadaptatus ivorii TaxID=54006 RepID=UPI000F822EE5|nr:hypothetical protein [Peptoniphilus ivorii]
MQFADEAIYLRLSDAGFSQGFFCGDNAIFKGALSGQGFRRVYKTMPVEEVPRGLHGLLQDVEIGFLFLFCREDLELSEDRTIVVHNSILETAGDIVVCFPNHKVEEGRIEVVEFHRARIRHQEVFAARIRFGGEKKLHFPRTVGGLTDVVDTGYAV